MKTNYNEPMNGHGIDFKNRQYNSELLGLVNPPKTNRNLDYDLICHTEYSATPCLHKGSKDGKISNESLKYDFEKLEKIVNAQ